MKTATGSSSTTQIDHDEQQQDGVQRLASALASPNRSIRSRPVAEPPARASLPA